jgi:LPXTG-site transpeptidase (sortase) family protein
MSHSNPALTFTRPILRPSRFTPKKVWTDADYVYHYDPERRICKRSPLHSRVLTGSMFFLVDQVKLLRTPASESPPAPAMAVAAPLLRSPFPLAVRLLMAGLWGVCIIAALVFVYPMWPAVTYEINQLHPSAASAIATVTPAAAPQSSAHEGSAAPAAASVVPGTANRLIVPSIGVNTAIVEGSSLNVLDHTEGVWHQTGSVTHGNLVLAGHRFKYLPPNTSTLYSLNKLQVGDSIILDWLGKRLVYHVTQMEVVSANDVTILNPTASPRLTLYSCNDILMTKRVVAIAVPSR